MNQTYVADGRVHVARTDGTFDVSPMLRRIHVRLITAIQAGEDTRAYALTRLLCLAALYQL